MISREKIEQAKEMLGTTAFELMADEIPLEDVDKEKLVCKSPFKCWYPRSVPAAGRWGNNAYLSSYLCDRARLSSQRFDAILFISQSQSPSQSSHPLPDGRCGLSLPVVSYIPHPCLQRLRRTRYISRPDAVCRLQWYMPLPVPA